MALNRVSSFAGRVVRALALLSALSIGGSAFGAERVPLTAEQLFDWAENAYSQYFPSRQSTQVFGAYVYRYYPETANYLGVANGRIAVLGPISGGILQDVGAIEQFECLAAPANCQPPTPSMFVATMRLAAVLDATGAFVLWGTEANLQPVDILIPGNGVRPLGVPAVQLMLGNKIGGLVDADGNAFGWGSTGRAFGQTIGGRLAFSQRVQIPFPGPVRQLMWALDTANGWSSIGLLRDGTVWSFSSERTRAGRTAIAAPPAVIQISDSTTVYDGPRALGSVVHAVTSNGEVWRLDVAGQNAPIKIRNVEGANFVSCSGRCFAVLRDGRVATWLVGQALYNTPGKWNPPENEAALVPGFSTAKQICGGTFLSTSGRVYSWRDGSDVLSSPTQASRFSDVTDLGCGGPMFIRRRDGSIWAGGGYSDLLSPDQIYASSDAFAFQLPYLSIGQ